MKGRKGCRHMADWQSITVGKPEIAGLDTRSNRLEVHFPLSDPGPKEWRDYLSSSLQGFDAHVPRPELRSAEVIVWSLEGEANLTAWIDRIAQDVSQANNFYENTVIPEKEAQDQARGLAEEDKQRRIQEAREQVRKLTNE